VTVLYCKILSRSTEISNLTNFHFDVTLTTRQMLIVDSGSHKFRGYNLKFFCIQLLSFREIKPNTCLK
jgi:hypothetical protein